MKANELRIGNLVYYQSKELIVDAICLAWLTLHPDDPDYSHIPLTEEWLLWFGFRQVSYRNEEIFVFRKKLTSRSTNFDIIIGTHSIIFGMEFLCFTFYIHQLQNLYFALTNEELLTKTK